MCQVVQFFLKFFSKLSCGATLPCLVFCSDLPKTDHKTKPEGVSLAAVLRVKTLAPQGTNPLVVGLLEITVLSD